MKKPSSPTKNKIDIVSSPLEKISPKKKEIKKATISKSKIEYKDNLGKLNTTSQKTVPKVVKSSSIKEMDKKIEPVSALTSDNVKEKINHDDFLKINESSYNALATTKIASHDDIDEQSNVNTPLIHKINENIHQAINKKPIKEVESLIEENKEEEIPLTHDGLGVYFNSLIVTHDIMKKSSSIIPNMWSMAYLYNMSVINGIGKLLYSCYNKNTNTLTGKNGK